MTTHHFSGLATSVMLLSMWVLSPAEVQAYPTDPAAQKLTEIIRLKWQQDVNEGKVRGTKIPPGAQLPLEAIKLRMVDNPQFDLSAETPKDPFLQEELEKILKKWRFRRYNIAILDVTDPKAPRYAAVNETELQTPGSTAKVLVAGGLFGALKKRFPNDFEKRRTMLKSVKVKADDWAMPNHHEVPVIYGDPYKDTKYKTWIRRVKNKDEFSLYQWVDHALSPSSNASASMVWREAMLLNQLGEEYPPQEYDAELFKRWDREAMTEAAFSTVNEPLVNAGLGTEDFYLRMFFTKGAGRYIKSESSRASPLGLMRWMLRMEQGRMVDAPSSLELKRMLYLTRRRIRYAHNKDLNDSAVFFKTGSLYGCVPEEGFSCGKYRGNSVNVLNSMVIVEVPPIPPEEPVVSAPDGKPASQKSAGVAAATPKPKPEAEADSAVEPKPKPWKPAHVYLVAVMSNELKRNAAFDHAILGGAIHELIQRTPPVPEAKEAPAPAKAEAKSPASPSKSEAKTSGP